MTRVAPRGRVTRRAIDLRDGSRHDAPMSCAWCNGAIPKGARRDALYCSKLHRQAAFRFRERRAELAARPVRARTAMRMAYADPPYPGLARRFYAGESSYAGEVDHRELCKRLGTYDGFALSTGAFALRDLLPLCPEGARVCPWVKPLRPSPRTYGLHGAWEPVIVVPGRRLAGGVRDWLYAAPARLGGSTLPGRKPLAFVAWVFDALGLLPGDTLDDLYPGSGVVSAAWREASRHAPSTGDASPPAGARPVAEDLGATCRRRPSHDASSGAGADVSRVGRRRRVPLGTPAVPEIDHR